MYVHTAPKASMIPMNGGRFVNSLKTGTNRRLAIPMLRIVICSLRLMAKVVFVFVACWLVCLSPALLYFCLVLRLVCCLCCVGLSYVPTLSCAAVSFRLLSGVCFVLFCLL